MESPDIIEAFWAACGMVAAVATLLMVVIRKRD